MCERPVIAIVMGDPAGIGPELIVKLLADGSWHDRCRPFIIGDMAVMRDNANALAAPIRFRALPDLAQARFEAAIIEVLSPAEFELGALPPPAVHPKLGGGGRALPGTGLSTRGGVSSRCRGYGADEQGVISRGRV